MTGYVEAAPITRAMHAFVAGAAALQATFDETRRVIEKWADDVEPPPLTPPQVRPAATPTRGPPIPPSTPEKWQAQVGGTWTCYQIQCGGWGAGIAGGCSRPIPVSSGTRVPLAPRLAFWHGSARGGVRMVKKALLIGINTYPGSPLRGCVNDAYTMQRLLHDRGVGDPSMQMLLDGDATRANIGESLRWLAGGAVSGDVLFVSYSGHGTYVHDVGGDERDGRDETICPVDFSFDDPGTWLTDDQVAKALRQAYLPVGVTLYVNLDCCNAGTMLRRPHGTNKTLPVPARFRDAVARVGWRSWVNLWPARTPFGSKLRALLGAKDPKVAMLTATTASQSAADAYIDNLAQGAHTWALRATIAQANRILALKEIRAGIARQLQSRGYLDQTPSLYGDQSVRRAPFLTAV